MSAPTVLVTGCSSGFGALIARTLARAGHTVFATMRRTAGANAAAAAALTAWALEQRLRIAVLDMDVTSQPSVDTAVAAVLAAAGRIDVLVNNAGRGAVGPLEAFSIPQMEALFSLNVHGPMRVNQAVLPSMRRNRAGLIVHVSSTIGRILPGTGGLYPATKWALEALAESLGYDVAPFGIDAVLLEPGAFPSPALSKAMVPDRRDVHAAYSAEPGMAPPAPTPPPQPGCQLPDPQEVADAVLHLIELPAGQRPLRTVVGPIFTAGVAEYNHAYERARQQLIDALKRPDQAISWARGTAFESVAD